MRTFGLFAALLWSGVAWSADGPSGDAPPTVAKKTEGLRKIDGFVPLYWDHRAGKLWMELVRFDRDLLVQVSLASGLGSNPVGLDRGQLADSRVMIFRRVGPKVLLVEPNQRYRAITENPAERRAVEESFAQSVHWGFEVAAEEDDGRKVLVDATAFFLRDAHGVVDKLRRTKQGSYRLDKDRSALEPDRTKGFPKNTEVESLLTFTTEGEPGALVSSTAPSGQGFSVRQRVSLIELPELGEGYTPRVFDPRIGVFPIEFHDFGTPFDQPVERRWICRHRLAKKDPEAEVSEPVAPIVYYVDRGAPEPLRTALVEGASWWNDAFKAAGYRDAFRVEVLPEDADPMDLRYNVIQWVHRSTRGWSYGNSVVDPRTGEILKGRVTLDSLRARQDALLGVGLDSPTVRTGGFSCAAGAGPGPEHLAALAPGDQVKGMVLARIRQLSAHEVGHTLGFAHNFAASTQDRASVMDYPAPLVKIVDGKLDLSDAYATGIGSYDALMVKYAYAHFARGTDESKALRDLLREATEKGVRFLSDADARPEGAAQPYGNLWDNGPDPVAGLNHEMQVRRIALERFGLGRIRDGQAVSELERAFLPVYLHHRYQLNAAAKMLGGVDYTYAVKEADGTSPAKVQAAIPGDDQFAALKAILATLKPEALVIPTRILDLLPPTAFSTEGGTAERFDGATGLTFDPLAPARVAADLAIGALLQPQRAARLADQHAQDPSIPSFGTVLEELIATTWGAPPPAEPRQRLVAEAVAMVVLNRLISLAGNESAAPQVRIAANEALLKLQRGLGADTPHKRAALAEIQRFLNRPAPTETRPPAPTSPPGDPIGSAGR